MEEALEDEPVRARRTIEVPADEGRQARTADFELRWTDMTFRVPPSPGAEPEEMEWTVIMLRESPATTPDGQQPVEWWLATTKAVHSATDAQRVVSAHEKRWRIEEFHRAWKSICNVEDTRLEDKDRIIRWAIILAAVAMRAERLKYYSRNESDEPATVEFDRYELDALITLYEPDGWSVGETPTIGEAVEWVGRLGGHANPHQGPAGTQVLERGLDELRPAAELLEKQDAQGEK